MPCGKKRKRHKIATHKRKKRLEKTDIRRSNTRLTGRKGDLFLHRILPSFLYDLFVSVICANEPLFYTKTRRLAILYNIKLKIP